MSADDFEATMRSLNPQGAAFNARLAAVTNELNTLQAIQRELNADEAHFEAHVAALRQTLEGTTRSLTSQYARRVRLVDELKACDRHIDHLEAEKERTAKEIHACTAARQGQREHKLASMGIPHPSQTRAAADSPEVGDLLSCSSSSASVAAPAPATSVDLLGLHTAMTPSDELLSALSGKHAGGAAVGDLNALAAYSGSLLSSNNSKITGAGGTLAGFASHPQNKLQGGGPAPPPVTRATVGSSGMMGMRSKSGGAAGSLSKPKSPGRAVGEPVDPFASLLQ